MIYIFHGKQFYWHALSDALHKMKIENKIIMKGDIKSYMLKNTLWIGQWKDADMNIMPTNYIYYIHNTFNDKGTLERYQNLNKKHGILDKAKSVWVFNYNDIYIIKNKFGLDCQYVPFGYSSYYESVFRKSDTAFKKDIEILFYGRKISKFNNRRLNTINKMRKAGLNVVWIGAEGNKIKYNYDLIPYIKRAKIVISIAHDNPENMKSNDLARLMFLLANKVFVIPEKTGDQKVEDQLSKHIIMCENTNELISQCKKYLSTETKAERQKIVESGYQYVKEKLKLDDFIPYQEIKEILCEIEL